MGIEEVKGNIIDLASEVRFNPKKSKTKGKARYIDDYGNILTYNCDIHPSRKFALIPDLMKFVPRPLVFWDEDAGENVIYIPSRQSNLKYAVIRDVAENVRSKVIAALKYRHVAYTIEIESESCIDWNLFKSDLEADLGADAFNVFHSKILKKLDEAGSMRMLFYFLLVGFAAYAMGITSGLIGAIILGIM